jgi:hypothetical protein
MLRTIALLVSLQPNQSPSCNTAELVLANADVAVAQALVVRAGRPRAAQVAREYLRAARERKRAAVALCVAARVPRKVNPFRADDRWGPCKPNPFRSDDQPDACKVNPFWPDNLPDPFDLESGTGSDSAFSDEAFFRAVVQYAADFGPKVAP